jgi:hypothetical protein
MRPAQRIPREWSRQARRQAKRRPPTRDLDEAEAHAQRARLAEVLSRIAPASPGGG